MHRVLGWIVVLTVFGPGCPGEKSPAQPAPSPKEAPTPGLATIDAVEPPAATPEAVAEPEAVRDAARKEPASEASSPEPKAQPAPQEKPKALPLDLLDLLKLKLEIVDIDPDKLGKPDTGPKAPRDRIADTKERLRREQAGGQRSQPRAGASGASDLGAQGRPFVRLLAQVDAGFRRRRWKTLYARFTPKTQELLLSTAVSLPLLRMLFGSLGGESTKASSIKTKLRKVLRKHGVSEQAIRELTTLQRGGQAKAQPTLEQQQAVMRRVFEPVKDKSALFTDLQDSFGGGVLGLRTAFSGELQAIVVKGDLAHGTLAKNGNQWPVSFRRLRGRWRVHLDVAALKKAQAKNEKQEGSRRAAAAAKHYLEVLVPLSQAGDFRKLRGRFLDSGREDWFEVAIQKVGPRAKNSAKLAAINGLLSKHGIKAALKAQPGLWQSFDVCKEFDALSATQQQRLLVDFFDWLRAEGIAPALRATEAWQEGFLSSQAKAVLVGGGRLVLRKHGSRWLIERYPSSAN